MIQVSFSVLLWLLGKVWNAGGERGTGRCYKSAFGPERMLALRGGHRTIQSQDFFSWPMQSDLSFLELGPRASSVTFLDLWNRAEFKAEVTNETNRM